MKRVQTTATVTQDGRLTIPAPLGIPPGEHRVTIELDDQPVTLPEAVNGELPVLHCGEWPKDLSLRREDLYDDAGR